MEEGSPTNGLEAVRLHRWLDSRSLLFPPGAVADYQRWGGLVWNCMECGASGDDVGRPVSCQSLSLLATGHVQLRPVSSSTRPPKYFTLWVLPLQMAFHNKGL